MTTRNARYLNARDMFGMAEVITANWLKKACFGATLMCFALFNVLELRGDQSIVVRSGNGVVGSSDAQIRLFDYRGIGDLTPTAQNFASAQTGPFASVVNPYPTYVQKLPSDPLAQWISTAHPFGYDSALYAIPFVVTDSVIASGTLNLGYAVDNAINGVYINGLPISGSSKDGDYHGEYYFLRSDIAPLLKPNTTNWLYLNVSNYGSISALVFSATITTQGIVHTPIISPTAGGNTGQVTVQVVASSGFQPGAQLSLTGVGSPIVGTNTKVVSPNVLTATLNLTGASPSVRTVTVTNPGGATVTLPNAFTIQQGVAPNLQIQKIGNAAVAGYNDTFFITVTNTGNVDSGVAPVNEVLEPWFTFVSSIPTPTSSESEINPFVTNVSPNYTWTLEWDVPNIPAGASTTIPYTVFLNPAFPAGGVVHGTACLDYYRNTCRDRFISCINGLTVLGTSKIKVAIACAVAIATRNPTNILTACTGGIGYCVVDRVICSAYGLDKCKQVANPSRSSKDPNDLVGPPGYGTQQWSVGTLPFQYALSFENLASATKPATTVQVSDMFDANSLDASTLTIGAITFGNSVYIPPNIPLAGLPFSADIDLRPAQDLIVRVAAALDSITNQTTVTFSSLDPSTGLPPTDPLLGFLAPGVGGTILFSATPKLSLATGTTIQDVGTVIFDTNPSIDTPTVFNTIDNNPPISQVSALPAVQSCHNFRVAWSGSDVGSGLGGFTVFAADSGGAFQPWIVGTTSSSGVYQGAVGHQYSFYALATDNAGNVEAAKTAAEASTNVTATDLCGPPTVGAIVTDTSIAGTTVTVDLQVTNTGLTNASAANINQITARTLSGSGTVTLSQPALPVSLGPLAVGASQAVTVTVNVPSTVARFSLVENGNLIDINGNSFNFSIAEAIIP
jgi:hypothetical protein